MILLFYFAALRSTMKRFLLFAAAIFPFTVFSQMNVATGGNNSDPLFLGPNVLSGGGLSIFNVTFSGNNAQQVGYYSNAYSAIGSSSGVVLSTGKAISAAQANDSTATSASIGNSNPSDADLLTLGNGNSIFDWFIMEFDVQVTGNQFGMRYVFASEEYQEYVCGNDADVFAILISGSGISGAFQNNADLISLVPSSSMPAGINSINNGTPGVFGNVGGCINSGSSAYYNDNISGLFEFDGYTDKLTATADVVCDSVYHIKIILADIGNDGFDSGLFLEERGVYSNGIGYFDGGAFSDSIIVEGCRPFDINIYNPTGFVQGQNINITLGGTATNGTDYNNIPSTYTLSSNDSLITIQIVPIADGITEGFETVVISYSLTTPCGEQIPVTYTLYIQDENPLVVGNMNSNTTICAGETVTLNLNVSGGFPAYTVLWNGVAQNNVIVAPTQDITYVAEVIDQAGCYWSQSFNVDYNANPIVNAGPDITVCSGHDQVLGAQIDGYSGASYQWTPSAGLNASNLAYPTFNSSTGHTYTVNVTTAAGCTGTDQVIVTVLPSPSVNAGPDQTITYLQTNCSLNGTGAGNAMWSPDYYLTCTNCFIPTAAPMVTTTYTLSVTGANGCVSTDDVTVTVDVPKDVFVPSAFSPNNDGNNDVLYARGYTILHMHFIVYDLWGQVMFDSFQPDKGWDGTVNGAPASVGLYVYTLEVEYVNDAGTATFSGEVNLVR